MFDVGETIPLELLFRQVVQVVQLISQLLLTNATLSLTDITTMEVGATVTGATSGTTGIITALGTNQITVDNVSGFFKSGEVVSANDVYYSDDLLIRLITHTSAARPATKTELKNYALRRLGYPAIDINVCDEQLDDLIEEAIDYYQSITTTVVTNRSLKF